MKVEPSILRLKYSRIATNDGEPKFTGPPDDLLFHRQEEYDVILMLQKIADDLNLKRESDLWELEAMINSRIPADIRTREDVYIWLIKNFEKSSRLRSLEKTIDKYIDDVTRKGS